MSREKIDRGIRIKIEGLMQLIALTNNINGRDREVQSYAQPSSTFGKIDSL